MHDNRIDALDPAWRTAALLGGSAALGALVLMIGAIAWRRLGPRWLTFLVGAFAGTQALFWSMKLVVDRPRPPLSPQLATVASPSFPSGHTAIAAAVGASLLVVAAQTTRTLPRRAAFAALVALPLIVGLSRLALGVHWLTDVVGGALLGFGWVLAWAALVAPSRSQASRIGGEWPVRPFADTRR